jgi:hypothetical protein
VFECHPLLLCEGEQKSQRVVSRQQLHEAAIAMSKAVKAGKSEAEVLEALAQSQAANARVEPRTATRERKGRSKSAQQVG